MTFSRYALRTAAALFAAALINVAPAAERTDLVQWMNENAITGRPGNGDSAELKWCDGTSLTLEGRAFDDTATSYSRLPMRAKKDVTPSVWTNAECASGVAIRFITDATSITASWDNKAPMVHMAYTGSGGLDLYSKQDGKWVFCGVGFPKANQTTASASLIRIAPKEKVATEYLLFLPLYSPVTRLELGVAKDCTIAPASPLLTDAKPVVFYGTSITMGGCASRAGMAHPAILRRWLDRPVINLGFSGAGKCEMAMSDILAEIPASLYVIETVSNMTTEMIDERVVPFVENLRKKQPDTPILLVDGPNATQVEANQHWHQAYEKLIASGVKNLSLLKCEDIFHGRENPTVDNSHPTDLGFYEMATSYEPVIRKIINQPATK